MQRAFFLHSKFQLFNDFNLETIPLAEDNMKIKFNKLLGVIAAVTSSIALYANAQVVESPAPDSAFDAGNAPDIVLNFSEGAPGVDYFVLVNGRDVSASTTAVGTEYVIPGSSIESVLRNGLNTLALVGEEVDINAPIYSEARTFFYNLSGPQLRIDNVTDDGVTVSVKGTALDPNGVASVSINGVNATVESDGSFTVDVTPAMDYRVIAQDVDGDVTQVDYSNFNDPIPSSASLRLDNSNLDILNELIADVIDDSDLADRLLANNPLYNGPLAGGLLNAVLNAESITINRPTVDALSTGSDLVVTAVSPDLKVRVDGTASACFLWFCLPLGVHGDILAPDVIINSNADVAFANDAAEVELLNFDVAVPEFSFSVRDIDDRPWFLRSSVIAWAFESIIELVSRPILDDTFTESLEGPLEEVLGEGFSTLAKIGLGLDVFGTEFEISVRPEAIAPVTGGVGLTANVDVQTVSGETGNAGLGYRAVNMSATSPENMDPSYELGLEISTDVVNQILWKVQKSGLVNLEICGATDDLTSLPSDLLGLDLSPLTTDALLTFFLSGSDFQLTTDLQDPPYLAINEVGDAEFTINIPAVKLGLDFIEIPLFGPGSFAITEITAALSVDANIDVNDGKISLDIVGSPIVALNIDEAYINNGNGQVPLNLSGLVRNIELIALAQIPVILPALEEAVSDIEIPAFAGLTITPEAVDGKADGSGIFIGASTEIGPEGLDLSILTEGLGTISIPLPAEIGDLFCEAPEAVQPELAVSQPQVEMPSFSEEASTASPEPATMSKREARKAKREAKKAKRKARRAKRK